MKYDCIIIGAGLSGLSAAALLAKRGLSVAVFEQGSKPGGCCGVFKRLIENKPVTFDQGASMLFGFGKKGFNSHRFLFSCLEEPFYITKHEMLYAINYNEQRIEFTDDLHEFTEKLSEIFPDQRRNIIKFYNDMLKMYNKVLCENPCYTTPDEMDVKSGLMGFIRHPVSYIKFLSYMNISAENLLSKYFNNNDILKFYDKLTSTYCYSTVKEAPAILASIMFVDNHIGGSWYPAGSTMYLTGILEKIIEENNGHIYYNTPVNSIYFKNNPSLLPKKTVKTVSGVILENDDLFLSDNVIFSGTVWNLYGKLLPADIVTDEMLDWSDSQEATYSSLVLYTLVDRTAVPDEANAIEMLASSDSIDESEITIYIPSIDDETLCDKNHHVVIAIGPSFIDWGTPAELTFSCEHRDSRYFNKYSEEYYQAQKIHETERIISILEKHYPGISEKIIYTELATPFTIERYTYKNFGSAAGPKQKLGQHMLKRQSIKSAWHGLYCCGESTTMGTGTPAVTVSGIAAANAVLKKQGLKQYRWNNSIKDTVIEITPPVEQNWQYEYFQNDKAELMMKSSRCLFCEQPKCCSKYLIDLPGIMRRAACGNFKGAVNIIDNAMIKITDSLMHEWENSCVQSGDVEITTIINTLKSLHHSF